MHPSREKGLRRTKWMIPAAIIVIGGASAALWAIFCIKLNAAKNSPAGRGDWQWLIYALAVSIAEPIVILAIIRRQYLLKNGIEVDGRVTSISGLVAARPITCEWDFNGQRFTMNTRAPANASAHLKEGATVKLLVDPKNPSRALLLEESA